MNTHVKQIWIAALRSGEYKRGMYGLRDCDDYYSPAGILCDLAVQAGIIAPPVDYTQKVGRDNPVFFGWVYYDDNGRHATGIPSAVQKWAELRYHSAYRLDIHCDKGWSFDKCADYIEKEF